MTDYAEMIEAKKPSILWPILWTAAMTAQIGIVGYGIAIGAQQHWASYAGMGAAAAFIISDWVIYFNKMIAYQWQDLAHELARDLNGTEGDLK